MGEGEDGGCNARRDQQHADGARVHSHIEEGRLRPLHQCPVRVAPMQLTARRRAAAWRVGASLELAADVAMVPVHQRPLSDASTARGVDLQESALHLHLTTEDRAELAEEGRGRRLIQTQVDATSRAGATSRTVRTASRTVGCRNAGCRTVGCRTVSETGCCGAVCCRAGRPTRRCAVGCAERRGGGERAAHFFELEGDD